MAINFLNVGAFPDDVKLTFGAGSDLQIFHNATDSIIYNGTGALMLRGSDVRVQAADASATYLTLDSSEATFTTDIRLPAAGKLYTWTGGDDNYLTYNSWYIWTGSDIIIRNSSTGPFKFQTNGANDVLTLDSSQNATFAEAVNIGAGKKIYLGGSTSRMQVYHTGSAGEAIVLNKEGNLSLVNQSHGDDIVFKTENISGTVVTPLTLDSGGDATFAGDVYVAEASNKGQLFFGTANTDYEIKGGGNYGYLSLNAPILRFDTGGTERLRIDANGAATFTEEIYAPDGSVSAPSISNTGDTNTGMYWPSDHQLGFTVDGSRKFYISTTKAYFQNLSSGVEIAAGGIDVTGDATIEQDVSTVYDGTTNQTGGLWVNNIYHEALNTFSQLRLGVSGASGASSARIVAIEPGQAQSDLAFVLRDGSGYNEVLRLKGSNQYVGIGTASPSAALDVQGSSALFMTRTSSGLATYIENDGGYAAQYMYQIGGGQKIKLHTNGVSFFNGGKVGIGTTSPGSKLSIEDGDLEFLSTNAATIKNKIIFSEAVWGDESFYIEHDGAGAGAANLLKIYADGSGGDDGGIVIARDTNVGIGTTAPYAYDTTSTKLHVKNASAGSGAVGEVARFEGSADADGSGGTIRLGTSNDRGMYFEGGRTGSVPYGKIGVTEYTGAKTLAITLDNSGNTTFAGGIQVNGPGSYNTIKSTNEYTLGLRDSNNTTQWWLKTYTNGGFALHENGVGDQFAIAAGGDATFSGNVGVGGAPTNQFSIVSGTNVNFEMGSNTTSVFLQSYNRSSSQWGAMAFLTKGETMRLTTDGRLGIGTTAPETTLHVDGTTLVKDSTGVGDLYLGNNGANNYFRFHTNNSNTYFDMNCGDIYWRQGASTRYYFYTSTANMTINGTLTQNSDSRVKENIVEIDDCISKVQAMRGVYYNRTDFNTEVTKVGVIAQEVETVLPELILESPEDGLKSVAYSELTAVLINAVKEQQEIIEDLKTRIEQLEN